MKAQFSTSNDTFPCACCGAVPCTCCCCENSAGLLTMTAIVTVLSGSIPWSFVPGTFTLTEAACLWTFTTTPVLNCTYQIQIECPYTIGMTPFHGCGSYLLNFLIVDTVTGDCFRLTGGTVFGECACDPLNLIYRFNISVTTTSTCCGASAGTYTAEIEVDISTP